MRRIYGLSYDDDAVPVKEKLLALKIVIQSNEARFKLLSEGPSMLAIKSLEDRLGKIELSNHQQQQQEHEQHLQLQQQQEHPFLIC